MSINCYDKLVDNWAGLLSAVIEHEEDLPNAGPLKYLLLRHLERVKAAKSRQKFHTINRLHCTKDLWKWIFSGRIVASRLRSLVKAELGPHDERLPQFGIALIRKRGRKASSAGEAQASTDQPN